MKSVSNSMARRRKQQKEAHIVPNNGDFGISITDFIVRAEECILVDKTYAIADFLSVDRPIHCLLRPRRSGKSTMLTMLKYVFMVFQLALVNFVRKGIL